MREWWKDVLIQLSKRVDKIRKESNHPVLEVTHREQEAVFKYIEDYWEIKQWRPSRLFGSPNSPVFWMGCQLKVKTLGEDNEHRRKGSR